MEDDYTYSTIEDFASTTFINNVTSLPEDRTSPASTAFIHNSSLFLPIGSITHHYHPAFVIVMSILMVVFILLSIIGNVLVILTVCRNRQMRTRTNIFLVNLAVADVMVAMFNMPVALVTLIRGRWVFGKALCDVNAFLVGLGVMLSIHTLMHIR